MPLSIPETEPATEFIDGRLVQKMSPLGAHARAQLAIGAALLMWAKAARAGRVGTEWDYDLADRAGTLNRLVPDVAFLSYERVSREAEDAAQVPVVGPDVAVEILSSGQGLNSLSRRIQIFFDNGTRLVILADPGSQRVWLIDPSSRRELGATEAIRHPSLPGFELSVEDCFD